MGQEREGRRSSNHLLSGTGLSDPDILERGEGGNGPGEQFSTNFTGYSDSGSACKEYSFVGVLARNILLLECLHPFVRSSEGGRLRLHPANISDTAFETFETKYPVLQRGSRVRVLRAKSSSEGYAIHIEGLQFLSTRGTPIMHAYCMNGMYAQANS